MQDPIQWLIEQTANDLSKQLDALIISALQKHIPDLTIVNIGRYKDRISTVSIENKPYPQRIYLDYGTKDEKLVFSIDAPLLKLDRSDIISYSQQVKFY